MSEIWARRRRTSHRRIWTTAALYAIGTAGILGLIVGWVWFCTWLLMTAWNAVMPSIFGLPVLLFWQAFALAVVINMLTGGVGASARSGNR